jgi:hypothetical protein
MKEGNSVIRPCFHEYDVLSLYKATRFAFVLTGRVMVKTPRVMRRATAEICGYLRKRVESGG